MARGWIAYRCRLSCDRRHGLDTGPRGAGTDALILGPRCAGVIHKAGPPSRRRGLPGRRAIRAPGGRRGATSVRWISRLSSSDRRPLSTTCRLAARIPDTTPIPHGAPLKPSGHRQLGHRPQPANAMLSQQLVKHISRICLLDAPAAHGGDVQYLRDRQQTASGIATVQNPVRS